ncbi:MAG: type II toxin-antitoxin system PemK/MazF family toxin [bacterium]|nr:type II toxin-antitoxin system PemK/MazF family toxin [bacterium]
MKKDFDTWNEVKKKRDQSTLLASPFPKEGTVWMCILGVNIGFEQNGAEKDFERPVLVVKKFNNQMYWAVPLSSKQKGYDFYFNFTDPNGLKAAAVLAQMRLISIKRFVREMYRFEDVLFAKIIANIVGFIDKSKPRTGRGFSGPSETEGTVKKGYTNRSKKSMNQTQVGGKCQGAPLAETNHGKARPCRDRRRPSPTPWNR